MGRLIRLDRSGHTTLAEWSAGEVESHEEAVEAFRRELDAGMLASVPKADGTAEVVRELPPTPSSWCSASRSPAASGRARWRRSV
jgi:hypothetical protein